MAITATHLTTASNGTPATSFVTASISPTANRLILVAVNNCRNGAAPTTPTISGNGLTYVQIATLNYDTAGFQRRVTLFRALGASPSAGAITIDFAGVSQESCVWSVSEFLGIDLSGTNGSGAIVQSATGSNQNSTTLTVTLAAFGDSSNATYGAFVLADALTISAGAGFTILGQATEATTFASCGTEFRNNSDTTVDASWPISSPDNGAIAVEIKLENSGTGTSVATGTATGVSLFAGTGTGTSVATGISGAAPIAGAGIGVSEGVGVGHSLYKAEGFGNGVGVGHAYSLGTYYSVDAPIVPSYNVESPSTPSYSVETV